MTDGRRWTVRDRNGDEVYLTGERWEHILDRHPEMAGYESELRDTIQSGHRKQDSLNPAKFRYSRRWPKLPDSNTHVEAVVLFRFQEELTEGPAPNNYIVTAYQKEIG